MALYDHELIFDEQIRGRYIDHKIIVDEEILEIIDDENHCYGWNFKLINVSLMKVLTISYMQNPRQISLYLNHDKEEHLPLLYKKVLLCCESWSIHKNMCNIRLYLNTIFGLVSVGSLWFAGALAGVCGYAGGGVAGGGGFGGAGGFVVVWGCVL